MLRVEDRYIGGGHGLKLRQKLNRQRGAFSLFLDLLVDLAFSKMPTNRNHRLPQKGYRDVFFFERFECASHTRPLLLDFRKSLLGLPKNVVFNEIRLRGLKPS